MLNLIAVLESLGYTATGAKTQKTVLAKKVLGMDAEEAKTTFMFSVEEVEEILKHLANGKGKYRAAAEGALLNADNTYLTFTDEYVAPAKPAKKKTKTKADLIEENEALKAEIEELRARLEDLENGRLTNL